MTPDFTVFIVIALVLLCTYLLNSLVFKPVLRTIDERERAVTGARELAQSSAAKATNAAAEYERTLGAARKDVYQQMDEKRRAALDRRAALLAATRAEVEGELQEATARVRDQAAAARQSLDRDASQLAGAIVSRVLGRPVTGGGEPTAAGAQGRSS